MNELPTLPDQNPAAASAAPPAARPEESFAEILQRPLSKVGIVLLVLIALLAWSTHNRFSHLRQDLARSLQKGEATNTETIALARQVQEQTKDLQA
jgi:uroporphyrin-3 C-methyltransferase/uroporphyrinogen III methyltransferase/synthase